MWMCHIDSIAPHTLANFESVDFNMQRFYGNKYCQIRCHVINMHLDHGIALDSVADDF